jgi:signal transduction histidine kinase
MSNKVGPHTLIYLPVNLMETFYTIALNFIFFTTCVMILIGMIFFSGVLPIRLLLTYCALLIMSAPYSLSLNNILPNHVFFAITALGICLFPISLALTVRYLYASHRQISVIPVLALSASSFGVLLIFPEYGNLTVFILNLFAYLYLVYMIIPIKYDFPSIILTVIILMNILYLVSIVYALEFIHYIISDGLMGTILSILTAYSLKIKLTTLQDRFNTTIELNKKLNRQTSRLKQSNDLYRKIIYEKDIELHQLARHASLAELTTGIAHELAQPLTGIKGIAQNMIDDIDAEEFESLQAVSELLKISSLVDKSSSIIDHIRNFSKKRILSMKPIDLNKVILDAIDLIQNQLKKNDIDLIFVLDDRIPKVVGDKISLEQLIVNIILNSKDAILEKEFDASSGENGTIRITTFSPANVVTMIIQDNGSGISEDIMHKIWSPFFTTKKRDHGTGIGLSICSKILKDHNANVDIQSNRQGTQFIINFPVAAVGEAASK